MREDAEVGAESGALWTIFVVRRECRFEVISRSVEHAKAQQGAAHRMMRFAAARRVGYAGRERLLRHLARALQVAEHEAKRKGYPQPAHGHLSAAVGERQQEHAIEVLLDFRRRIAAPGVQRNREARSQRQLLLVAIASRRQRLDERQRMGQTADRLFTRRHARGDGGSTLEKRHCPGRLPPTIEVHGD